MGGDTARALQRVCGRERPDRRPTDGPVRPAPRSRLRLRPLRGGGDRRRRRSLAGVVLAPARDGGPVRRGPRRRPARSGRGRRHVPQPVARADGRNHRCRRHPGRHLRRAGRRRGRGGDRLHGGAVAPDPGDRGDRPRGRAAPPPRPPRSGGGAAPDGAGERRRPPARGSAPSAAVPGGGGRDRGRPDVDGGGHGRDTRS